MKTVYVAGHRGMVGAAIVRRLSANGESESVNIIGATHSELDLTQQADVRTFFASNTIDEVYLAAAKVGGIHANNTYPAEFIYDNLMVQANVVDAAYQSGVRKLLFLGSSCIYPKLAQQPIAETELMQGALEPTNEPYAMAKIAGIKLCESYNRQYDTDYRSVMPTNLYGPGDNYNLQNSHVIPALIRKFHLAKLAMEQDWPAIEQDAQEHGPIPEELLVRFRESRSGKNQVPIWGSGTPKREFLYVDDMAAACVHVMSLDKTINDQHTQPMLSHINVGCGQDITIRQLAGTVARTVGYTGDINFDPSQPDGTPRKLMDSTRLKTVGWQAKIGLEQGLAMAYQDFLAHG